MNYTMEVCMIFAIMLRKKSTKFHWDTHQAANFGSVGKWLIFREHVPLILCFLHSSHKKTPLKHSLR